ncbi:MAG: histidine kinase, partial [Actinobacteria bacterium]|nr:histidine kinase [Actinomycetota bacterium]
MLHVCRPRRSDLLVAAAVGVLAELETWSTATYDPKVAYAAAALAMAVPLAWRRVAPIMILALVYVPLLGMAVAGYPLDSAYVMLVLLLAFAAVGGHCERRQAVVGLVLGLALLTGQAVLENVISRGDVASPGVVDVVFVGVIVSAVWGLAVGLRERSLHAGELEQRAERLEREHGEQERLAVAQERARIARELHDVVAHSVSVIAVQTGSLRHRLRHERPAEAQELSAIERTAREALAEMRRMLGLLRADDDALSLTPQPGIDDIDRLVAQIRQTGLAVTLDVRGDRRPLA